MAPPVLSSPSTSLDSPTSSIRSSSELDRTSGACFAIKAPSVEFGVPEMTEFDDAGDVLRADD
jgi:hypothetical protein